MVGGAHVEAGAFVLLATGDNVDDEFVFATKWNAAAEVVGGMDVASAQCTSKNNDWDVNDSNLIHNKNALFKKNYKSSLLEDYMYIRTE